MKQKQKLNHVYYMYISLPSHHVEAKMKWLKTAGEKKRIPPWNYNIIVP